jgi:hypothetical protein
VHFFERNVLLKVVGDEAVVARVDHRSRVFGYQIATNPHQVIVLLDFKNRVVH